MDFGGSADRDVLASERIYRKLIRAYPEEVRRRYADEMVGYFGDLCREERLNRGTGGMVLLWARALPELFFTALSERGALFRRNAYLPAAPGSVARFGALCALIGGILGVAFHLIEYSLLGAIGRATGGSFGNDPFTRFFTFSLLLSALSLSSLGLFGLYGAVVARSGRPGPLAGAGAVFAAAASFLWLSISGYSLVHDLASGTNIFAPFEWVFYAGSLLIGPAMLFWFLGLLLLGIAAALRPLPRHLRILPLALLALIGPAYMLGGSFEMIGGPGVLSAIVMGLGQGLPFVGVAVLGWALLRDYDSEPFAASGSPAEDDGTVRDAGRPEGQTSNGRLALALVLIPLALAALAYSFREDLYRTYLGLQPGAQSVGSAAYVAGERLDLKKTAGGARVTLTSVYAEEQHVTVSYEVEDLTDDRRAGEHPAELQPLIGFEGDEKKLQKQGLGNDIVDLTDESGTSFRMVNNSGEMSEGPNNMGRGPLHNMAAFEPEQKLEPGDEHRFTLKIPLVESPVVAVEEKMPPPEPFEGGPFVFDLKIPVRAVPVVDIGQKVTAEGVTLTLDRVINSPGKPQAVICYEAPDDERMWFLQGGRGTDFGGWGSSGSMKGVTTSGCQKLLLNGPQEGRSSLEVVTIDGMPDCPQGDAKAAEACFNRFGERQIKGPWSFEFEVPES